MRLRQHRPPWGHHRRHEPVHGADHIERAAERLGYAMDGQFYGRRDGMIEDPFGHIWDITTVIRDIAPGDMQQVFDDWLKSQA